MINILFFLKPLFDMLWQFKVLDLILILLLLAFLLPRILYVKLSITYLLLITFSLFIFRSFLAQPDSSTVLVFVKILSAFLMFFAAQFNKNIDKTINLIEKSYIIPIVYVLTLFVLGKGFVYWGNALTFVGPYFYKTDLAIAIVLSVIFFRSVLYKKTNRLLKFCAFLYIFAIVPYLILEANSRMFLIILGIFYIIIITEYAKNQPKKISKGFIRILVFASVLSLVAGYSVYDKYLKPDNALEIDLSVSNIFSLSNTQGRSGIWTAEFEHFSQGHPFYLLFGYNINKDIEFNTYSANGFDAHNTYIKILVNFGIFGLLTYFIILFLIYRKILSMSKLSVNINKHHLTTIQMIFVFFIISGFSQSNIAYTQSSWYAFYFMGLIYNSDLINLKNKINKLTIKGAT